MNKKKVIVIIVSLTLIFGICYLIFNNKMSKSLKNGNNRNSQEIVNYILNVSSYTAKIEVEIKSNKNENKYIIKQEYINEKNNFQEILEPENIAGVRIRLEDNKLVLENTDLNLTNVYENYKYIAENDLDLICFINDYKNNEKSEYKDKDEIIMTTKNKKFSKKLYIDKNTGNPTRMDLKDENANTAIYILYNEIKI